MNTWKYAITAYDAAWTNEVILQIIGPQRELIGFIWTRTPAIGKQVTVLPLSLETIFSPKRDLRILGYPASIQPVLTGHPKGLQQFIGPQGPLILPLMFRLPAGETSSSTVSWPFARLHDLLVLIVVSLYFRIWNKPIFSTKMRKKCSDNNESFEGNLLNRLLGRSSLFPFWYWKSLRAVK